jgi:hypothetical protein
MPPEGSRVGRWARPWLRVQTEENTATAIYGVIVCAAVMSASHATSVLQLEISVLVTLTIYWSAERYSRLIAERIHEGHRPTWQHVRAHLTSGWELVTASFLPLVVLTVLSRTGADLDTSVLGALVCSTVVLGLAGWEIGAQGRLHPVERWMVALGAGSFGLVFVALKALLH